MAYLSFLNTLLCLEPDHNPYHMRGGLSHGLNTSSIIKTKTIVAIVSDLRVRTDIQTYSHTQMYYPALLFGSEGNYTFMHQVQLFTDGTCIRSWYMQLAFESYVQNAYHTVFVMQKRCRGTILDTADMNIMAYSSSNCVLRDLTITT